MYQNSFMELLKVTRIKEKCMVCPFGPYPQKLKGNDWKSSPGMLDLSWLSPTESLRKKTLLWHHFLNLPLILLLMH